MAESSRVHFDAGQVQQVHNSEIVVQQLSPGTVAVHLGFLQIHHSYEITFNLKDDLEQEVEADLLQNLHVKLCHAQPSENGEGHQLKVQLYAHKEKLMKEQIAIRETNGKKKLNIIFNARVLGKGKGKPSLLDGIHCIGVNEEEDSDLSDWQGFD